MTCYFRHIKHIFKKAGIDVSNENKRAIDRRIHEIVNVDYKNCPGTWKEVKRRILEDEEGFISDLSNIWKREVDQLK